ncbi:cupredoxin domain-containing protein [Varunaivibrio sulfuroxidans]|uniref:Copper-binding protein n=1 Tax=Varunaivibrio sulfuroxidans TaxID=1773489 RepID=A0A4R3J6J3_9PROT|nr:hypothetical protein [Varunaivibrio sulfuroxidans]TCS60997.1 hypothetical protein EDD55_109159 [Varunaivibrio sulfuroxidans]WES31597.1 hypothetical protein P3M64_04290 [Varunaivibrio sulfuroxidans]
MKMDTASFLGLCVLVLTTVHAPSARAEESVTFGEAGSAAHVDRTVVVEMKAMAEKGMTDTMTVPWAVSVPAGKTKELIWKFAGPPTKIKFDCNIPGHYESGMTGVIDITK